MQLSVYPDGIGDNLSDLKAFLSKHIDGRMAHWLLCMGLRVQGSACSLCSAMFVLGNDS